MIGCILAVSLCLVAHTDPTDQEVRQTVERSLPYLARGGETWIEERGCVSCHRVSFMIWSHSAARGRGIEVDDTRLRAWTDWAFVNMLADREERGGVDTISQVLLGRDRGSRWRKKPPRHFKTVDPYETLFEVLLQRQSEDGSWPPEGQLSTPPEITTGWALLALDSRRDLSGDPSKDLDPEKDLADELAKQVATIERQIPASAARGGQYLRSVEPHPTNEGLVLRVMLAATGDSGDLAALRQQLIEAQNVDGGWSNRLDLSVSDAYATGQTLYALSRMAAPRDQAAIARARHFLVRSQRPDGSWMVPADHVRNGARRDSLDEIFSYWGTAWASVGLLQTLPAP